MGRSFRWLRWWPAAQRGNFTRRIRAHNWQLYEEDRAAAAVRLRCMPVMLHLQTTQKCNFRCIMCTRQQRGLAPDHAYPCMDRALLEKVADEGFPYATSADLSVSGEPLTASNLDQSLHLARLYGVALNITTNGSLLGRPGMLEKLAPVAGLLSVSIDAATAETYGKIRPGGRFDEILAAVKRYDELRKAQSRRSQLMIYAVLMRANVEELPDMVRQAHRLGADTFAGAHVVVLSDAMKHESLLNCPDLYDHYRAEALRVAESLGQTVVLPAPLGGAQSALLEEGEAAVTRDPGSAPSEIEGPIRCPFSHRSLYIQTDGRAIPCCNEDPELPMMGNARRQSLREIWNSDAYLELREGLRTGRLTSYCRRCYIIADQVEMAGRGLLKTGAGL
jgi:radical SAM protein with 4Fe4S-binding SPASM domain